MVNPFQFTGRESDTETGLYYYRARYYDQSNGRFLSEDPLEFGGGIDFYDYVSNNPVNLRDPFGLCTKRCPPSGKAPSPGYYASQGLDHANNPFKLLSFHRGGSLDTQQYGSSAAYANYVFGVYMASAGYSLSFTLYAADTYGALFSRYPNTPLDDRFTHIPTSNVININQGFNDEKAGTLCQLNPPF